MKNIILIAVFLISANNFAQVNRFTKYEPARYEPRSFEEIALPARMQYLKAKGNLKYLNRLQKRILRLRPKIKNEVLRSKLEKLYNILSKMQNGDLANASQSLQTAESIIDKIVSDYNIWVNQQNSNQENESNIRSYVTQGINYYENKEYALAIRSFSEYLEYNSTNTDVLFLRALAKSNYGDRYGAISDYNKIIKLNSNYPMTLNNMATVYNNKAYCLYGLENYDKALPLVQKALELDKSKDYIWGTRGAVYLKLGKYEKSISDYNKAIKIKEKGLYFYRRGLAYAKLNKLKKACKDFSKSEDLGYKKTSKAIVNYCN